MTKKPLDQAKISKILGSTYEPLAGRSPLQAYAEMKIGKKKAAKGKSRQPKKERRDRYPRITALGVTVYSKPLAHVKWAELKKALGKQHKKFTNLFGCQTCCVDGPYPYDVEAVLERMASGRLTGTQAFMD